MNSNEIREGFLSFFKSKGHDVVLSAPVVIKNDPTLMFTNAGMNQFKDVFLDNKAPKNLRVADTQKCMRVSGKHNDLEDVGVDTYHHTLFEMLGNWSFGDYFKKEAINWAWELLTEVYKIDKDRIYVTVFGGDVEDKMPRDSEAYEIWKGVINEDRIIEAGKKDNFWEMGDTGPSGPCSEIHVDIRSEEERQKTDGKLLVNQDHPQVIEVWNLVFMEFNRLADRSLVKLPKKHVDTGMGLERLAMVLQKKQSNYDTDLFVPIIKKIEDLCGKTYKRGDTKEDIAFRVIADHIRAISFSIADGQLPSNTGAGYVVRRILRRAVRYGFSYLKIKEPFLHLLLPELDLLMGGYFTELNHQKNLITNVVKEEEESFLRTLDKGLLKLHQVLEKEGKSKPLSGEVVFELYDTYGFPPDLTSLILKEEGTRYDEFTFAKKLQEQKQRSKKDAEVEKDDWVVVRENVESTFVGYDMLETEAFLVKYRKVLAKNKTLYHVVLNKSPFYAESGGQVGDKGILLFDEDKISVIDTKKENDLTVHLVNNLPSNVNGTCRACVNGLNRRAVEKNHSATHLLHYALRKVLGEHVEQKGSLVNAGYLRFDFSHFSKLTKEELLEVEFLVNEKIQKELKLVETRNIAIEEAKEMGAMALFGEKYSDKVRVIRFGESLELCGGTHVKSTVQIGLFKIVSEGAIAAGIRRIEAITSTKALAYLNEEHTTLDEIRELVKNPKEVSKAVKTLLETNTLLEKKIEGYKKEQVKQMVAELALQKKEVNGVNFIAKSLSLEMDQLKDLAYGLKDKVDNLFLALGSVQDGKASLLVLISENIAAEKALNAGKIIKDIAREIKGGGGGQPLFATAGGKHIEGIKIALKRAEGFLLL